MSAFPFYRKANPSILSSLKGEVIRDHSSRDVEAPPPTAGGMFCRLKARLYTISLLKRIPPIIKIGRIKKIFGLVLNSVFKCVALCVGAGGGANSA